MPRVLEHVVGFRDALASSLDELSGVKLRWQTQAQLHITLKFLGELAESRVSELEATLEKAISSIPEFDILLEKSGCFPQQGPLRIVWAGVADPSGNMSACAASIEEHFSEIGFPKEKRTFSPHITLARVKTDNSHGELRERVQAMKLPSIAQHVHSVSLFQSRLLSSGAEYLVVAEKKLSSGG